MKKKISLLCVVLACFLVSLSAAAALIIPTSASDTIISTNADDQAFGPFSAPSGFSFFGLSAPSFFVSSNGNLSPSGNTAFTNVPLPATSFGPGIFAFWDDLFLPPGNIRVNTTNSNQLTVIFNQVGTFNNIGPDTFEAVLLGAGNSLGSPANSILFSFADLKATSDGNVTIGLGAGDGRFATLPGSSNGVFTNANLSSLSNMAYLFTANGRGYTVAPFRAGTVPEPSTLLLALLGLSLLAPLGRRGA